MWVIARLELTRRELVGDVNSGLGALAPKRLSPT
jgi:hypothetical protein